MYNYQACKLYSDNKSAGVSALTRDFVVNFNNEENLIKLGENSSFLNKEKSTEKIQIWKTGKKSHSAQGPMRQD